jgi:hypothetical protein
MVTLRSDNRVLTQNVKYAFLTDNYSKGVNVINITSTNDFKVNDFILIGDMGKENAEIFRIGAINASSGDITLQDASGTGAVTLYGHQESSKVYQLPYNQVMFYWTAATGTIADETPVFSTTTALSGWLSLDPTSWYTVFADTAHSTGFGWFIYRNSATTEASTNSNPIPYGGFSGNTVASVFADFDSLLNISELKLVTVSDKFSWLNEALAQFKNKLNLSNVEYTVSVPQIITVFSGVSEYQLPDDFSDLISVSSYNPANPTAAGTPIDFLPVYKVDNYQGTMINFNNFTGTRYYIRNRYIGFTPTPTQASYYQYRYRAKSTRVTSLSDYIDLPENGWYILKSWMLYRSGLKFSNPNAQVYLNDFNNTLNLQIQSSVKRDANLDSFSMDPTTNV